MTDNSSILGFVSIGDAIAFVALIVAFASVMWFYTTRRDQRRERTLDLITGWRLHGNPFFAKLRALKKGEDIARFADSNLQNKDEQWIDKRNDLIWLIDYFELISVGVYEKIYDKKILVKSSRALFAESYDELAGFIAAWRRERNQPTCCEYFERFANELRKRRAKELRKRH